MPDLSKVSYCGLYCGLCSACNRTPRQAGALRETLRKDGWEHWGKDMPDFLPFWGFLNRLANSEAGKSCRNGCGFPPCGIRKCAQKKDVDVCAFCDEYPCHRIESLAQGYVNLIADAKRMREIGLERWIEEQEERKKTGFCYADIRCHPYTVPSE